MGVARLLLEKVVDVVGADVGTPRLLPLPRALRRLPHRRRCWLLSFTRTRCGERKPPVEEGGGGWGDEGVLVGELGFLRSRWGHWQVGLNVGSPFFFL